jgi:simple sugar transport system ATP-binding protein
MGIGPAMSSTSATTATVRRPVLSVIDLSMTFGATRALVGVDLDLHEGEVLGVIGTNGAGKSTLIKIISGVHHPTGGTIVLDGATVAFENPLAASRAGIETVHQQIDQGIVPGMTAAENLVLDAYADGSMPVLVNRRLTRDRAASIADAMALQVDLDAPVETLSPSDRQQLVIARALARQPRVLILDEPTSTLSIAESQRLHETVRRMSGHGVAVIYISHVLGEIEELCDRVLVLRDGEVRGSFARPMARTELVATMLGELTTLAQAEEHAPGEVATGDEVLRVTGAAARPGGTSIDLVVRRGEILGVTGLIGAGKTELLEQVFAARPLVQGSMALCGRAYAPRDPADAVMAGVAFVPEDRATLALIPHWSVTHNITLPYLATYGWAGFMRTTAEHAVAGRFVSEMRIRCAGPDAEIASLSGGNQQKVVVARWLQSDSPLLILDEPFRGIDIGSRSEIVQQLRRQRDRAVIVASSDPEEIIQVADRIVVLAGGILVGELPAREATTARLVHLMAGGMLAGGETA